MPPITSNFARNHASGLTLIYQCLDAGLIFFALALAVRAHLVEGFTARYVFVGVSAGLFFMLLGHIRHLYASWRLEPLHKMMWATTTCWSWTMLCLVLLAFLTKTSSDFSRWVTAVWFVITPVLLISERLVIRFLLDTLRRSGRNTRTLAIAGQTSTGLDVLHKLQKLEHLGMRFVGCYDTTPPSSGESPTLTTAPPLAGDLDALVRDAKAGKVDYVFLALPMREETRIAQLANDLSDTTASVFLVPNSLVYDLINSKLSHLDNIPLICLYDSPFDGVNGWVKRLEDIIVASLALILMAIPMAMIALAIKSTSPGPVIFRQKRYGLNGNIVEIWKFRSMTVTEDDTKTIRQASKDDARITPLGAFLRRTSLDELPQFFNVLQGSMSVVGPRPHAIAHNEQYRNLIRGYMIRHKVKPGITGLAQIHGWRGETDTLEKMDMRVHYDLEYVRTWTLWFDIEIIIKTIRNGFVHPNAY